MLEPLAVVWCGVRVREFVFVAVYIHLRSLMVETTAEENKEIICGRKSKRDYYGLGEINRVGFAQ